MRRALVATVVFFLCALAAYALRRSGHDAPHPRASPPTASGREGPSAETSLPVASPALGGADGGTPSLEAILERLPKAEHPPARAPIWGRVTLDDSDPETPGAPVAGARIEAWPVLSPAAGSPLEEWVRAWADEERSSREGLRATTTDAAGRFELRDLVRADYRIEAKRENLCIVSALTGKETYRPGEHAAFVASRDRPFDLEIDVIAADGRRPEEAFIEVKALPGARSRFPWGGHQLEASVYGAGHYGMGFRWSPRRRSLRIAWDAELIAHGPGGSLSEKATVSPSSPRAELVLHLLEPRGITLEVAYPPGAERRAVRAAVMRIDPSRPPTVARFARGAKWVSYHDAMGLPESARPLVTDIPTGTYRVGCELKEPERWQEMTAISRSGPMKEARGGQVDGWTTVVVTSGLARARIALPEPTLEDGILARVLGLEGEFLDGLQFRLELVRSSISSRSGNPVRVRDSVRWDRRSDGSYVLWPRSDVARSILAGEEPGEIEVIASHESLAEARGSVLLGASPLAEIFFREPGRLLLLVEGTDDPKLVERVHVELSLSGGGRGGPGRLRPAATDGMRIEHDRIPPGGYEARVRFSCGGGAYLDLASETVSIPSGDAARLTVRIPELHPLEVRTPAERGPRGRFTLRGEGLSLRLSGGFRSGIRVLLPPGSYDVIREVFPYREEFAPILRFQVPEVASIDIPGEEEP